MLLPGCGCCDDCGCGCGTLPYTFTVQFSELINATHSVYCSLAFSSNFGFGATGVVTAPGGCDAAEPCCEPSDRGPITGVLLTNGGSCYAVCGRKEPTLQIAAPSGVEGATFTPTFEQVTAGGLPYWIITAIDVSGGTGFVDGDQLSIFPINGSTQVSPANFRISFDGETAAVILLDAGSTGAYYKEDCSLPPIVAAVTVTACGEGAGAIITPTIDSVYGSPTFGQITNLTITDGGNGYLAWSSICRGWNSLNGIPFVLRASNPKRLVTIGFESCYGSGACATVDNVSDETCGGVPIEWDGAPAPIRTVTLVDGGGGYAKRGRKMPEWTITQDGWTFEPTFEPAETDGCGLPGWSVVSFEITSGTVATHNDGWKLEHTVDSPEFADKYVNALVHTRQEPIVSAYADDNQGYGAEFSVSVEEIGGQPKLWRVSSVSGGGGYGYPKNVNILFSVPDRLGVFGHYAVVPGLAVGTIDENGSIVSVELIGGGAFFLDNGLPQSVEIIGGGFYYREDPTLTPYVADVNAVIYQAAGSSGSGATITATVEDDTSSADFGKIVSLSVSGGYGYSYFGGPTDCQYFGGCRSGCGVGDPSVKLIFQGHGKPAIVRLEDLSDANGPTSIAVWETYGVVADCTNLPASADLLYGSPSGAVTLTPGGSWDSRGQEGCDGCPCIRDLVNDWQNQPISITSDCPCKSGTISGSGTIGNFSFDPCVVLRLVDGEFEQEIDVNVSALFSVECLQHGCEDTGDCVTCISVFFGSYVYAGENVTQFCQGESGCTCDDIAIGEDGFIHGTVTVNTGCCTVTVVFG